ncbi:MAG: hypothetical protein ACJAYC_000696 [Halieaceae bacterium]|jgi:hypothetical protein
MHDNIKGKGDAELDVELANRFAQLRRQESAAAPAYREPARRRVEQSSATRRWTGAWSLPRAAAAVAVAAIAVSLFYVSPEDDPARLYAGIMQHQSLQTDALLIVSDSVLPAMNSLPQMYDIEEALDADFNTSRNPAPEKPL